MEQPPPAAASQQYSYDPGYQAPQLIQPWEPPVDGYDDINRALIAPQGLAFAFDGQPQQFVVPGPYGPVLSDPAGMYWQTGAGMDPSGQNGGPSGGQSPSTYNIHSSSPAPWSTNNPHPSANVNNAGRANRGSNRLNPSATSYNPGRTNPFGIRAGHNNQGQTRGGGHRPSAPRYTSIPPPQQPNVPAGNAPPPPVAVPHAQANTSHTPSTQLNTRTPVNSANQQGHSRGSRGGRGSPPRGGSGPKTMDARNKDVNNGRKGGLPQSEWSPGFNKAGGSGRGRGSRNPNNSGYPNNPNMVANENSPKAVDKGKEVERQQGPEGAAAPAGQAQQAEQALQQDEDARQPQEDEQAKEDALMGASLDIFGDLADGDVGSSQWAPPGWVPPTGPDHLSRTWKDGPMDPALTVPYHGRPANSWDGWLSFSGPPPPLHSDPEDNGEEDIEPSATSSGDPKGKKKARRGKRGKKKTSPLQRKKKAQKENETQEGEEEDGAAPADLHTEEGGPSHVGENSPIQSSTSRTLGAPDTGNASSETANTPTPPNAGDREKQCSDVSEHKDASAQDSTQSTPHDSSVVATASNTHPAELSLFERARLEIRRAREAQKIRDEAWEALDAAISSELPPSPTAESEKSDEKDKKEDELSTKSKSLEDAGARAATAARDTTPTETIPTRETSLPIRPEADNPANTAGAPSINITAASPSTPTQTPPQQRSTGLSSEFGFGVNRPPTNLSSPLGLSTTAFLQGDQNHQSAPGPPPTQAPAQPTPAPAPAPAVDVSSFSFSRFIDGFGPPSTPASRDTVRSTPADAPTWNRRASASVPLRHPSGLSGSRQVPQESTFQSAGPQNAFSHTVAPPTSQHSSQTPAFSGLPGFPPPPPPAPGRPTPVTPQQPQQSFQFGNSRNSSQTPAFGGLPGLQPRPAPQPVPTTPPQQQLFHFGGGSSNNTQPTTESETGAALSELDQYIYGYTAVSPPPGSPSPSPRGPSPPVPSSTGIPPPRLSLPGLAPPGTSLPEEPTPELPPAGRRLLTPSSRRGRALAETARNESSDVAPPVSAAETEASKMTSHDPPAAPLAETSRALICLPRTRPVDEVDVLQEAIRRYLSLKSARPRRSRLDGVRIIDLDQEPVVAPFYRSSANRIAWAYSSRCFFDPTDARRAPF